MPPKGPRGWAPVGSARYNILQPHAESYLEHQQNRTLRIFFPNIYKEYFTVFHYTLGDNEDPDPETVYAEPETEEEMAKKFAIMKVMKDVRVYIVPLHDTVTSTHLFTAHCSVVLPALCMGAAP